MRKCLVLEMPVRLCDYDGKRNFVLPQEQHTKFSTLRKKSEGEVERKHKHGHIFGLETLIWSGVQP